METCLRNASRAAGQALVQAFKSNPLIGKDYERVVPEGCALDSNTDIYAQQERRRSFRADGLWRCGYCGKTFVSESYLDQHVDRRHADTLPAKGKARCLGTLCSFLPCQHFRGPPNVVADGACTDQRVAQARQACQEAIRGCFHPDQGPRASAIHEYLQHQLCDPLHCDPSQAPHPSHFHFTWRPPHPYTEAEVGQLSATAGFLIVLIVVAILALRSWIRKQTIPEPDLGRGSRRPFTGLRPWSSSSKRKLG